MLSTSESEGSWFTWSSSDVRDVLLDPLLPLLSHVGLVYTFVHGLDDRCTASRNDEKEDTLSQLSRGKGLEVPCASSCVQRETVSS